MSSDGLPMYAMKHPTLTPMSDCVSKQEGHVIVENHETGQYEDFESVTEFVGFYVAKMKSAGRKHQAISCFKRKWRKRL